MSLRPVKEVIHTRPTVEGVGVKLETRFGFSVKRRGNREATVPRPNKEKAMSRNIEGKVVVITGASSGLGESTARHLAKLGATVVLGARRKGRLDAIVKNIQADGAKALAVSVDVTNRAQVEALVQKAINTYGKIDVLGNNAGIMRIRPLSLLKVDEWDPSIDLSIKGELYGTAAALPQFNH